MQLCQVLLEASYAVIIILRKVREMAVYITESSRELCQAEKHCVLEMRSVLCSPVFPHPPKGSPFPKQPLLKPTACLGEKFRNSRVIFQAQAAEVS